MEPMSVMTMLPAPTQMAHTTVSAIQVTQTPEMPEKGNVMVSLTEVCWQC